MQRSVGAGGRWEAWQEHAKGRFQRCSAAAAPPPHRRPPLPSPQTMCKARSLGGKDTKDNLRAKLLRSVRQDLGLPVYGPENVSAASVRLPQQMTEEEMRHLFDSRWVGWRLCGCGVPGLLLAARQRLGRWGGRSAGRPCWPTLPCPARPPACAPQRLHDAHQSVAGGGHGQRSAHR